MGLGKSGKKTKDKTKPAKGYRAIVPFARMASPVFMALYFVCITAVALSGIVALIIFLVNTPVEKMLLPPLMTLHGEDYYSIFIGNGIRIDAAYDTVSLMDVKTVIWAELIMCAAASAMLAPVCLNMSRLMKNVAAESPYNMNNARYTMYIGLSVMIGYTVVLTARRFYNYLLVRTFVAEPESIHLSMGLDLGGVVVGLLIILLGCVIGHVSELHIAEAMKPGQNTDIQPVDDEDER